MTEHPFMWATGIEDTFVPHTRPGLRALDEYELTQHYQQWRRDFDLVAESGATAVRWGIPWYRVQPAPDRWDWEWTDRVLDYLVNVKGITPILDLVHYGTPLWMDNSFINARYPDHVAEYARRVAERYKSLVRYYTPLNEPMVNAEFCGSKSEWPPYLSGDDGYVKMVLALARGIVLTTQAIRSEQHDAVIVQVEALWHTHTRDRALEERAAHNNARQYLCMDLTTGRMSDDHELAGFLRRNGAAANTLDWFRDNAVSFDILGANFYPWSYGELKQGAKGSIRYVTGDTSGDTIGLVVRDARRRYGLPVMVTETSANGDIGPRSRWMDETVAAVRELRTEGIPVVGYTWFPLFTMIEWEYRRGRRPLSEYLIHLGLYDAAFDAEGTLQRRKTPLVDRYRRHMDDPMLPLGT